MQIARGPLVRTRRGAFLGRLERFIYAWKMLVEATMFMKKKGLRGNSRNGAKIAYC